MKNPYAGVGRRALATIIDAIPMSFVFVVIVMGFGEFDIDLSPTPGETAPTLFTLSNTGLLLLVLFSAFYYVGMELTFGGTVGKLMTGLRVRNADGSSLSIKGAVLRFLFRPIDSLFTCLVAAIFVWTTNKNQRLGDIIGGTIVSYRELFQEPNPRIGYDPTGLQSF